ncbi:type 4a pilus biogenesis protein PilO [Desulfonatronospira sp.]|uniref:type 4a pilus biogenesis protein PilO n=1 Tax=Desulfonatronospira sp. TaxID=1962951 RepID=UPI0025C73CF2|nr:type 4a pilus biogenesis protein PilO [Desulfonatronospira sp.]
MKISRQQIISAVESVSMGRRLLILALLIIIIGGGSWHFFIGPQMQRISELESELESLEIDILTYSRQAEDLEQKEEEARRIEHELELARTLLPADTHALERLLASFERLGNEKGVRFLLFQPGSEEEHDYFASRSVQLRLEGRFHDLMSYFDALAGLDRLVSLESLRLRPVDQQQFSRHRTLTAESRLRVYRALTLDEQEPREDQ